MKLSRSQELLTSAHNELGVIKYNVTTKILPKAQKKFEELKELKDKKRELEILAQAKGLGYPPGYSPKFYASNGVKLDKKPDNKNNRYRPSSS